MADLDFCVPLIPPSVNHYVKHTRSGRHYVTKEAKAFKSAVALLAREQRPSSLPIPHKWYSIEIYVNLPKGQKLDIDNCAKVILDGLVEGGQIHSDAAVTLLCLHKKRGNHLAPSTCITVWEGKPA